MKKLLFLLLFLLPILGTAQPMDFNEMNYFFNSIARPTQTKMIAVSGANVVYASDNGGNTWTGRKLPVSASLNCVHMADGFTGWAVGNTGAIFKTSDGGVTWTQQTSNTTFTIRGVHAVNAMVAYACGGESTAANQASSVLLKTVNGGATWTSLITPSLDSMTQGRAGTTCTGNLYRAYFNHVYFMDADTGYVVGGLGNISIACGGGGKVLKTTNGGASWTISTIPSTNFAFRSVHFPPGQSQYGFAVGNAMNSSTPNNFWKTSNWGATWTNIPNGNYCCSALNTVRALDANNVYVGSSFDAVRSIVRRSEDGGNTWVFDTLSNFAGAITALAATGNEVTAVGGVGLIKTHSQGVPGWTTLNGSVAVNAWEMAFADNNTAYIAANGGQMGKSIDGGNTWTFSATPTTASMTSVTFTSPTTGFATGASATGSPVQPALKLDPSGNWVLLPLPSGTTNQYDMSFTPDGQYGWSVGSSGSINYTSDGGNNWVAQTSGSTAIFQSVFALDANNAWAVGTLGNIRKWNGTSWTTQTLPPATGGSTPQTTQLNEVWFADPMNGYVCGLSGKFFKTTDGGATWVEKTTGTTQRLEDMEWLDSQKGLVTGGSGIILFTTDGGNTFSTTNSIFGGLGQAITKIPGISPSQFIICYPNLVGNAAYFILVNTSMTNYHPDGDGDGYAVPNTVEFYTPPASGYLANTNNGVDCNDQDPAVNPGATEICNLLDDNCDGSVDEGSAAPTTFYADADGDSYGDPAVTQVACTAPSGHVSDNTDCNDADAAINPSASEICFNTVDENCNGEISEGCPPLAFTYQLTASCSSNSGNSVTVDNILGGAPPFLYSKNGGTSYQAGSTFAGLTPGIYTIVVKDANNATSTQSVEVKGLMAVNISTVSPACFGGTGSLSAVIAGGYPTYSYIWTKAGAPIGGNTASLTNMTIGAYKVTVTDEKGCTKVAAKTLTQPTSIGVMGIRTNITCNNANDGTISLSISGGTPGYTFLWSDGATTEDRTGLAAGTYSCTVTDANGCTKTSASYTVVNPTALAVSVVKTNILCLGANNGTATANPVGGTGTTSTRTYLWSNGATTKQITGLAAGTYSVTVGDANGCTVVGSATISEPASAVSITGITSASVGANYTVTVTGTGGTAPRQFRRSIAPGVWTGYNGTGIFTNVPAGTYTFQMKDKNNCTVSQDQAIPVAPRPAGTGRHETTGMANLEIAPNPVKDVLNLRVTDAQATGRVLIFSTLGKLVLETDVNLFPGEMFKINVADMAAGSYSLQFRANDGTVTATKQFILAN